MRGNESIAGVEGTLSRGKRDRDLVRVQTLSERTNLHVYLEQKADLAVQGGCTAQRRLCEAEADMDKKILGTKKFGYGSPCNQPRTRISKIGAIQWADQAQREKINLC